MAAHISIISKQKAANAVSQKLLVLENWLISGIPWKTVADGVFERDESGERQLDYFPTNISQFGNWDGQKNSALTTIETAAVIYTNRSTLYCSNEVQIEKIQSVCKQLAAKAAMQLRTANKNSAIKGLNADVEYLQKLTAVQANELTAAALELNAVQTEFRKLSRELVNLRQRYDDETQQLKERNAELTVTLKKLTPLRREGT